MKKAFTLIEFMVVVAIVAIIASIAIPAIMQKRPTENVTKTKIGNSNYNVEKFTLEGHSYFMFRHSEAHGFSAVHNPECPKCKSTTERVEK